MVEVIYKPRRRLVLHEYIYYENLDDLVRLNALGVPAGGIGQPLHWVDGVALRFVPMPMNETVTKELLQDTIHWDHVSFALMPKYQHEIRVPQNNVTIPVIDVDKNEIFLDVAVWLKDRVKMKV